MSRIFRFLISLTIILTVLSGCASINYIGTSYPPTEHVDLYFSEEDIEKEYSVIGRILATANSSEVFYSSEKFTEEILAKAQQRGADAVVILGFGQVVKPETVITDDGVRVSSDEKRRIEALAIKYKNNLTAQ